MDEGKTGEPKVPSAISYISIISIFLLIFLIYIKITNQKEVAQQKKISTKLADLAYTKDRMLTNTSHELRTPLNGIIGLSEVILSDHESDIPLPTLELIKLIKLSGEQLSMVVNDILQISTLKDDQVAVMNTRFKLDELIREVIVISQVDASKHQHWLTRGLCIRIQSHHRGQ